MPPAETPVIVNATLFGAARAVYVLVIESPTGLIGTILSNDEADRLFDAGVNFEPDPVSGVAAAGRAAWRRCEFGPELPT
jgi:hypothetical protein